jgi:predicted permease
VPITAAAEALTARARTWSSNLSLGHVEAIELALVYDDALEQSRVAMSFVVASVGVLVLLIIVNVAGLVGSQGAARRQELAVRASMGAGRGRLMLQQFVEASCLGVAASIVGALAALLAIGGVVALLPLDLPPHTAVAVNWRVFAATVVIGVMTAWISVAVPAWRLSSFDLRGWISGHNVAVPRRWAGRPGQLVVFLQVSLAAVLLTGGGLLVQTVNRLLDVDLGFQPAGLHALEVVPTGADPMTWRTFYPALVERMRQMPGISAVGATDWVPLSDQIIAFMATKPGEDLDISLVGVTPGFDRALGLSVREGRWFGDGDREQPVTVLSLSAARALGVDPRSVVGTVVDVGERLTVIGVVDDIRGWGPRSKPQSAVYTSLLPHHFMPPSVVFRTDGPAPTLPEIRAVVASMGTRAVVERIRPGEALLGENIERPRQRRGLLVLASSLGLVLALVGVAGIAMSSVTARTREIGVRMAFGANATQVVRLVAMDAVWPSVAGVAAGLAAAAYGARVLETFLFNTSSRDPLVFGTVGALIVAVAAAVAWIPARMAARVNPVDSLRAE